MLLVGGNCPLAPMVATALRRNDLQHMYNGRLKINGNPIMDSLLVKISDYNLLSEVLN